jgi:histone H3/H4
MKMASALVVKSSVRSQLKGMRAGGDFFKALDVAVANLLKTATARAKENGRKTCRGCDV